MGSRGRVTKVIRRGYKHERTFQIELIYIKCSVRMEDGALPSWESV